MVEESRRLLEGPLGTIVKAAYPQLGVKERLVLVEVLECYIDQSPPLYMEVVERTDVGNTGAIFSGKNEINATLCRLELKRIIKITAGFFKRRGHGCCCDCCCELTVFIELHKKVVDHAMRAIEAQKMMTRTRFQQGDEGA